MVEHLEKQTCCFLVKIISQLFIIYASYKHSIMGPVMDQKYKLLINLNIKFDKFSDQTHIGACIVAYHLQA